MASRMIAGKPVEFSEDGFLSNPNDWTNEMAQAIAREEGIETFSEAHWQVINYCRAEGLASGRAPSLRAIVTATGIPMKELFNLFPKSPDKKIARVTGLRMAARCI